MQYMFGFLTSLLKPKYRRLARVFLGQPDRRRISTETRLAVYALHGRRCLRCGSTHNIQIDHIVPYSWGGGSEISNLQPLCGKCNRAKSNTSAADYRRGW